MFKGRDFVFHEQDENVTSVIGQVKDYNKNYLLDEKLRKTYGVPFKISDKVKFEDYYDEIFIVLSKSEEVKLRYVDNIEVIDVDEDNIIVVEADYALSADVVSRDKFKISIDQVYLKSQSDTLDIKKASLMNSLFGL